MKRAIEKLREYSSEDEITNERLSPFLEAAESGNLEAMKKTKSCLEQFLSCGHGIEELYFSLF